MSEERDKAAEEFVDKAWPEVMKIDEICQLPPMPEERTPMLIEDSFKAGYDAGVDSAQGKLRKLKQLILLVDESVSDIEMNEITARQWAAYIKEFPEESDL